jgi:tRNA-specific 2-thiouridylase
MLKDQRQPKKVFVAMSGGVDSSVAAALLKKRGFDVTGVFFKPWQPESGLSGCMWRQDRRDAAKVAETLGIGFKTWNFAEEYEKEVTKYMLESYKKGATPNPDVMCNKKIKFGLFLKKALQEGADFIATGHYVRKIKNKKSKIKNNPQKEENQELYKLLMAKDKNKDQSYFLWTLTQKQLEHCLFPIGDFLKSEVRKMAKDFDLPVYDKKDSQGICFVGKLNVKDFLKSYIPEKKGEIKLFPSGKTIGYHDGTYYYTIGQRHGLDLKIGGGPYFVVAKDLKKNLICVTKNIKDLNNQQAEVEDVSWVSGKPIVPFKADVRVRYRNKTVPALITGREKTLLVKFLKPAVAIAPGQSAVFYRGQEMLGGGILK